jgi:type IX secretion system substrate protein/beta-propeller uncharacterized protein DUF5122
MKKFILPLSVTLLLGLTFPLMLTSQTWTPLGSGMGGFVTSVTVYNGELIAGGNFTIAGGTFANRIARWNGSSWAALGLGVSGSQNFVQAVQVYNGLLYVGGNFTFPSGYIAAWNGSSWLSVGGGTHAGVYDFDIYGGELVMCGNFNFVGGLTVNYVAKWNGSSWSALGSGMNQAGVYALAVYNGELIAAGNFTSAGGVSANNIAKWNGSSWSPLSSGVNNFVLALGVYNGELYAGGDFTTAGGVPANRVARWNGSSWSPLGNGVNATVLVFDVYNSELVVGGAFNIAGGISVNYIARWDGVSWYSTSSGGMNSFVRALGVYGSDFIAGGSFTNAGGVTAFFIARTDDPLPVVLSSFNSTVVKNSVKLDWVTAEEVNNRGFDVERKEGDETWARIGYIEGNGTTNEPKSYSFIDRNLQKGKYRYRLRQIDYNGNFELHNFPNEVSVGAPSEFSVSQNYPNPSNPSSKIDYQLPRDGRVTIQLYDVAGRIVATILDEIEESGYYTFNFDGSRLASGIYFYTLITEGFTQTKKIILIK